jgi:hypothetical protein
MIKRYPLDVNIVQAPVGTDTPVAFVGPVLLLATDAPVCFFSTFLHG